MPSNYPRTYILIHGAHHGGWCWNRVAPMLRARGHNVYTPSYTGAGEREHLLSANTDLHTYIEDILQLIRSEELSDVILVGHSFGGRIISGVVDIEPAPVRHLVYFDAGIPVAGVSVSSNPEYWGKKLKTAIEHRGVRCFAPVTPESVGVLTQADQAWLRRRLTPMPVKAFESVLELKNPLCNGVPKTYLRCARPEHQLAVNSVRVARELGWPMVDIEAGHDAMITAPGLLCEALESIAN